MESWTRCRFSGLAKKAQVMSDEIFTYSLVVPQFSIDFDVKTQSSIQWTRGFDSHGPNFVFAVADTWLRINYTRHLVISEFDTGNLIETLRSLAKQLRDLSSTPDISNIISRGGLSVWMDGYWDRLNQDCSAHSDEAIYNLLEPLCISAHDGDYIAAYIHHGLPTIEVATRPKPEAAPIHVWSEFDPEKMASEVRELQQFISAKILHALRASNPS
jgi:hypothetical protein